MNQIDRARSFDRRAGPRTLGLVLVAAALNGMLSSGIDRTLVDMPAWQHVGPVAWAGFSRWADLGPAGITLYPTEGIGGTLLTIAAAAVALSGRRGLTRGEVAPIYAAAVLVLGGCWPRPRRLRR